MRIADSTELTFFSANNDHRLSMWVSEKVKMDLTLDRMKTPHSTPTEERNYLF